MSGGSDVLAEAVEAAAAAIEREHGVVSDVNVEEARAALAAALPVVLAKLEQRIDGAGINAGTVEQTDAFFVAAGIVRAFATEVTG